VPKYYGKVVYILEKKKEHMFVGSLFVENPSAKTPSKFSAGQPVDRTQKSIWFKPVSAYLPWWLSCFTLRSNILC
jgi:hypothetical protein